MEQKLEVYEQLSEEDLKKFTELFETFQDTILSMIRHAVRVLPNNKNNPNPSIKAYSAIKSSSADIEYEKVIDIKDIFLHCLLSEKQHLFFKKSLKCFVLDSKKNIRFNIKKTEYEKLDNHSKQNFVNDVKKLEKIIYNINNNFNQRLPEAKRQGMLMISKIKNLDVPDKAKYQGRTQSKEKGRSV